MFANSSLAADFITAQNTDHFTVLVNGIEGEIYDKFYTTDGIFPNVQEVHDMPLEEDEKKILIVQENGGDDTAVSKDPLCDRSDPILSAMNIDSANLPDFKRVLQIQADVFSCESINTYNEIIEYNSVRNSPTEGTLELTNGVDAYLQTVGECGYPFSTFNHTTFNGHRNVVLKSSELQNTSVDNPVYCNGCNKGFETQTLLQSHIQFRCPVLCTEELQHCFKFDKTFTTSGGLQQHIIAEQHEKKGLKGKVFMQLASLEYSHSNLKHLRRQKVKCSNCNKIFISRRSLLVHREFYCPLLPKVCIKCSTCERICANANYMRLHVLQEHNTKISLREANSYEKVRLDPRYDPLRDRGQNSREDSASEVLENHFICDSCKQGFNTIGNLREHIEHCCSLLMMNTGLQRDRCNEQFSKRNYLQRHASMVQSAKSSLREFRKCPTLSINNKFKESTCEYMRQVARNLGNSDVLSKPVNKAEQSRVRRRRSHKKHSDKICRVECNNDCSNNKCIDVGETFHKSKEWHRHLVEEYCVPLKKLAARGIKCPLDSNKNFSKTLRKRQISEASNSSIICNSNSSVSNHVTPIRNKKGSTLPKGKKYSHSQKYRCQCILCGKRFFDNRLLQQHILVAHNIKITIRKSQHYPKEQNGDNLNSCKDSRMSSRLLSASVELRENSKEIIEANNQDIPNKTENCGNFSVWPPPNTDILYKNNEMKGESEHCQSRNLKSQQHLSGSDVVIEEEIGANGNTRTSEHEDTSVQIYATSNMPDVIDITEDDPKSYLSQRQESVQMNSEGSQNISNTSSNIVPAKFELKTSEKWNDPNKSFKSFTPDITDSRLLQVSSPLALEQHSIDATDNYENILTTDEYAIVKVYRTPGTDIQSKKDLGNSGRPTENVHKNNTQVNCSAKNNYGCNSATQPVNTISELSHCVNANFVNLQNCRGKSDVEISMKIKKLPTIKKLFTCEKCKKCLTTQKGFKKHYEVTCPMLPKRWHQCSRCEKRYLSVHAMRDHIITEHIPQISLNETEEYSVVMEDSKTNFPKSGNKSSLKESVILDRHSVKENVITNRHSVTERVICDSFDKQTDFLYTCAACYMKFQDKVILQRHIEFQCPVYLKYKPTLQCTMCDEQFTQSNLQYHVHWVHNHPITYEEAGSFPKVPITSSVSKDTIPEHVPAYRRECLPEIIDRCGANSVTYQETRRFPGLPMIKSVSSDIVHGRDPTYLSECHLKTNQIIERDANSQLPEVLDATRPIRVGDFNKQSVPKVTSDEVNLIHESKGNSKSAKEFFSPEEIKDEIEISELYTLNSHFLDGLLNDQNEIHVCNVCNKSFSSVSSLSEHLQNHLKECID